MPSSPNSQPLSNIAVVGFANDDNAAEPVSPARAAEDLAKSFFESTGFYTGEKLDEWLTAQYEQQPIDWNAEWCKFGLLTVSKEPLLYGQKTDKREDPRVYPVYFSANPKLPGDISIDLLKAKLLVYNILESPSKPIHKAHVEENAQWPYVLMPNNLLGGGGCRGSYRV